MKNHYLSVKGLKASVHILNGVVDELQVPFRGVLSVQHAWLENVDYSIIIFGLLCMKKWQVVLGSQVSL